jgi:hypothetical protein
MRIVLVGVALLTLALGSSCLASSYGDPASGFLNERVEAAFVPLDGTSPATFTAHGAAVVLASGVAVTNAHNANIVDSAAIVGRSNQYDLLFFRTARGRPIAIARPKEGLAVIAYGQGENGELRVSYGTISRLNVPVRPVCPVCAVQQAFVFESNAGPGFSGGPVVDARDGHLVGITFGYLDIEGGKRQMFAYDMGRVKTEFAGIEKQSAVAAR